MEQEQIAHEWIRMESGIATVGITERTQKELGEIVYVQLPAVGKYLSKGDEAVILESTKAATDIYSPISGEVVAINTDLLENVDRINTAPHQEGWLFKVKV